MKTNKKFLAVILSVFVVFATIPPHLSVIKTKAVNVFLSGDVNNDNIVSTEDALSALRFAAGIEAPTQDEQELADADFDGKLETEDARKILRIAASIEPAVTYEFTDWFISETATCQKDGIERSYCEEYDIYRERTIPKSHNFYKKYCTYCGEISYIFQNIYVLDNVFHLGDNYDYVVSKLGVPTKTYSDKNLNGEDITHLVYHKNFVDYTVITIQDSKIINIYTFDKNAKIELSNGETLHLNEMPKGNSILFLYIKQFYDEKSDEKTPYACQFSCDFNTAYVSGYSNTATVNAILADLANATRVANGASILNYSAEVEQVALAHTMDMYENNYFSHRNANNENVANRLNNAGIYPLGCGENLFRSSYTTPYQIHNEWYNSLGHRKVMLNNYTHIGIGTYIAPVDWGYCVYVTQNYIRTDS